MNEPEIEYILNNTAGKNVLKTKLVKCIYGGNGQMNRRTEIQSLLHDMADKLIMFQ